MQEFLTDLAKISPIVGVLIYFIWYFQSEIKAKNDEIKQLNQLLRDQQKETLIAISKLTDVVESLKDLINAKIK